MCSRCSFSDYQKLFMLSNQHFEILEGDDRFLNRFCFYERHISISDMEFEQITEKEKFWLQTALNHFKWFLLLARGSWADGRHKIWCSLNQRWRNVGIYSKKDALRILAMEKWKLPFLNAKNQAEKEPVRYTSFIYKRANRFLLREGLGKYSAFTSI